MRVFRKIMALTLALTLTLSMGAVTVFAADAKAPGGSGVEIKLNTYNMTLEVGESDTLRITNLNETGDKGIHYTYYSHPDGVIALEALSAPNRGSAIISAEKAGVATVEVKVPGLSSISVCTITVTPLAGIPWLKVRITAAEKKMSGVYTSKDGTDVASDHKWVTPAIHENLANAVAAAVKVRDNTNTTPEQAEKAVEALEKVMDTYLPQEGTMDGIPKLKARIISAKAMMKDVEISKDGTGIANDKKWVTQEMHDDLITAIKEAEAVPDSATWYDAEVAVLSLQYAMDEYKPQSNIDPDEPTDPDPDKPTDPDPDEPTDPKFADLEDAITAANKLTLATTTSEKNGADVAKDKTWVTKAVKDAFDKALTAAKAALKATTQKDIDVATDALNDAVKAYKPLKGTKPASSGGDDDSGGSSGGGAGGSTGGNNTANTPATSDKVNSTVDALKDPTAALPKDVVKTTTAGGAAITTIPVAMSTGSANVGSSLFETLGSAPATVGLKLTVSNGMYGGSMEVIIPGGFGKITEPGRFSFPMDYSATAEHSSTMTSAVKGDNAVSMTAKVGGNFTLPVTATVTVPTKLANGSIVNIYKYDPLTNKLISIGKAVVKDGKLTFATKMMGEMLFTTGTV